ncbi:MAG: MnmC family methyltransferase, partial [Cyanobacteria bacterium J06641_5]
PRQITSDGSETFFSETFGEAFHSRHGASQEAVEKFVLPCQLPERATSRDRLCLLDVCYGLGYNSAAALDAIWAVNPKCHVELYALELNLQVCEQAATQGLLSRWRSPVPSLLVALAGARQLKAPQLEAHLLVGDARQTLPTLHRQGLRADGIFFDPFSPPKCPQLWSVEFIALTAACLAPDGYLATYSCAAALQTG